MIIDSADAIGPVSETAGVSKPAEPRGGFYAWYVVVLLTLCYVLCFLDAKLPFILTEAIKADLGLTDTQIGFITGPVFSITYAVFGVPVAKLSDKYSRKYVISVAIVIWSGFTAAGAAANSFLAFMLTRTGVAAGESACAPASHSLITQYVPARSRATAMAIHSTGIALGSILALVIGGILVDMFNWRVVLLVVGGGGAVLAALVIFTLKEPPRPVVSAAERQRGSVMALLRDPALRHIMLGGTAICFMLGATSAWTPAYVMRQFDMTATQAGASLGALGGGLALIGIVLGGVLSDWLAKRDRRFGLWLLSGAFVIAAALKIAGMLTDSFPLFLGLSAVASALVMFYPGPTFTAVQQLADPRSRSLASAVVLFCLNGVGIASGTFVAGLLSDLLAPRLGEESLRWSLVICSLGALLSAFHYLLAGRQMGLKGALGPASQST